MTNDQEIFVNERDASLERDGLLEPGQPTETAHMKYMQHPAMQLLRKEATARQRRDSLFQDLYEEYDYVR